MHDTKDDRITRHVNNKLTSRGFCSPCNLRVQTSKGQVTLSASVQYAHRKGAAVRAISGIAGVRRVVDQVTVKPTVKRPVVSARAAADTTTLAKIAPTSMHS